MIPHQPMMPTAQFYQQQHPQQPHYHPQHPSQQPHGQQHPSHPQSQQHMIYQEFKRMALIEDWYIEGSHKNRILLALQSQLPNEIDWAFNKLILLSYLAPDHFVLNMIPGIVDSILEPHCVPFLSAVHQQMQHVHHVYSNQRRSSSQDAVLTAQNSDVTNRNYNLKSGNDHSVPERPNGDNPAADSADEEDENESIGNNEEKQERIGGFDEYSAVAAPLDDTVVMDALFGYSSSFTSSSVPGNSSNILNNEEFMERLLQILHIFRNFSFSAPNVPILVSNLKLLRLVFFGLKFSAGFLRATEVRCYCLDIIENLSISLRLKDSRDPLFVELKHLLLHSQDRAMIIGALRTLTRLSQLEYNEIAFSEVDPTVVKRLVSLLFVWDEELVACVLDFLYTYSGVYGESVGEKIAASCRFNIIHVLMKFIEWRKPGSNAVAAQRRPVNPPVELNPKAVEFCINWWKGRFEYDGVSLVSTMKVYGDYAKSCGYDGSIGAAATLSSGAVLPFPEFVKRALSSFPGVQTVVMDKNICLKGLKLRTAQMPVPVAQKEQQEVDTEMADDVTESSSVISEQPASKTANSSKDDLPNEMNSVTREVSAQGSASPHILAQQTLVQRAPQHQPIPVRPPLNNVPNQDHQLQMPRQYVQHNATGSPYQTHRTVPPPHQRPAQQPQQMIVEDTSSIPLSAALVLRNLAQCKQNRLLFLPYESELVKHSVSRMGYLHESVIKVLANILYELSKTE